MRLVVLALLLVGCCPTPKDPSRNYSIQVCVDEGEKTFVLRHFIPGAKLAGYSLDCKSVELECDKRFCSWSVAKR